MNVTEYKIRKKYRYSNLSYVFDVYMECEYRANLTKEEYEGLSPGEFRFDYKSWERRLEISKKQLVRAIKELLESGVIIQTLKGKKGVSSKYFLARFEEQNLEQNGDTKRNTKGTEKGIDNTSLEGCLGTERGIQKEQNEEQKKVQSSQYNNLNIISNKENIYKDIINYLNEKANKKYRSNTPKTKALINTRLKEGFTEEDFYKVIDIKTIEWKNTDFENYLRPETLFGNKFEGYLNTELKTKVKQKKSNTYFEV